MCVVHQDPWALRMSGSRTGWQGGRFSKLWLKAASLLPGNVCGNPVGRSATPHCFAHLAKLKSVKQVRFFFLSYSGLPPFWATVADLAHVHQLKHNLSYDSGADVAQTPRTIDESLQHGVIVKNILSLKLFLITEGNNWRSAELHFPSRSPYIRSI